MMTARLWGKETGVGSVCVCVEGGVVCENDS